MMFPNKTKAMQALGEDTPILQCDRCSEWGGVAEEMNDAPEISYWQKICRGCSETVGVTPPVEVSQRVGAPYSVDDRVIQEKVDEAHAQVLDAGLGMITKAILDTGMAEIKELDAIREERRGVALALLAACKRSLEFLENDNWSKMDAYEIAEQVRAAIARAEGDGGKPEEPKVDEVAKGFPEVKVEYEQGVYGSIRYQRLGPDRMLMQIVQDYTDDVMEVEVAKWTLLDGEDSKRLAPEIRASVGYKIMPRGGFEGEEEGE